MKILLAHLVHGAGLERWYQEIASAASNSAEVRCFCLTLDPPGPPLTWPELDRLWRARSRKLMQMYERLQQAAEGCDVLLNYNGYNLHPEFLQYLSTFNVYCCFDDPESSANASAQVAASYAAVFYGNIASRFQYESWGCKKIAWLPVFTAPSDVPPKSSENDLFSLQRDVDIVFVGERTLWRTRRLEMLSQAFPEARCHGRGWNAGVVDETSLRQLYRRAKIGWNIHNSTGPINRRLFALAGHGVLPICDNRTGLGQIFELGKSAIGFDTVPEAIEATRYYLEHENERLEISGNAYQVFWEKYHANAIWQHICHQLNDWGAKPAREPPPHAPRRPGQIPTLPVIYVESLIHQSGQRLAQVVRAAVNAAGWRANNSHRPTHHESVYLGERVIAYRENPEMHGVNMARERLIAGDPLDWPNILALNWAVTALIGKARRIIEIGSGTGPFAEYASVDGERSIVCIEEDDFARNKAIELRSRKNVQYHKRYDPSMGGSYDLLVSIEVIEHVADLDRFIQFCARLAPRAIFTTPNRLIVGDPKRPGPPAYPPHVREFAPGELYWVLKLFYKDVYLYHMPDVYVPWLEPMDLVTQGTPVIAECSGAAISK